MARGGLGVVDEDDEDEEGGVTTTSPHTCIRVRIKSNGAQIILDKAPLPTPAVNVQIMRRCCCSCCCDWWWEFCEWVVVVVPYKDVLVVRLVVEGLHARICETGGTIRL